MLPRELAISGTAQTRRARHDSCAARLHRDVRLSSFPAACEDSLCVWDSERLCIVIKRSKLGFLIYLKLSTMKHTQLIKPTSFANRPESRRSTLDSSTKSPQSILDVEISRLCCIWNLPTSTLDIQAPRVERSISGVETISRPRPGSSGSLQY
jgi:hypothetical protein